MVICSSNDFHIGLKIIISGEPYAVESSEFVKPGKGQAFVRVKLRRLLTGARIEKTFKSTDYVKKADITDIILTYLYNDSEFWYFINKKTFDQLAVSAKIVGNNAKWIISQADCTLTLWNDQPIAVIPPNFVELEVIDTDFKLKNNALSTGNKLATLSTGAIVKVPLFIHIGDIVRIDTRSGTYVSRIK